MSLDAFLQFPLHLFHLGLVHSTCKLFLRGLENMHPVYRPLTPQWSLQSILWQLMRPPFKPLTSASLCLLALKTAFLLAISLACRAGGLATLRADPFFCKVTSRPDLTFFPKVFSAFHLKRPAVLTIFYPTPSSPCGTVLHALDGKRALSYDVHRTTTFRTSQRLLVTFAGSSFRAPASSDHL